MKLEFNVEENSIRLDVYLSKNCELSRSEVQRLIKEGNVLVNSKVEKSNYKVCEGDFIILEHVKKEFNLIPQDVEFEIVYEDEHLIVVNKPLGLVVHPGVGNPDMTLVNGLLYHFDSLSDNDIRPGIVHRIDKDTTGLLVVAKNNKVHDLLSEMIKSRELKREYIALVHGNITHTTGTIDAPIGRDKNNRQQMCVTDKNSKHAVTNFEVLEKVLDFTLIKCILDTGRTHQIRVHMQYINHPIVGDMIYGRRKTIGDVQLLHAFRLTFKHPVTNEEIVCSAPIPKHFKDVIKELNFEY